MTEITHTEEAVEGTVVDGEPEKPKTFLETPGHEHFRPLKTVKGSDQMRLIGKLQNLGLMSTDKNEADVERNIDLDKMADLVDYVSERFTHDSEAFDQWTMGDGGFQRALEVTVAYAGLMGEDNSSGR